MPQTLLEILIARYPTAKRQTLRRMVEDGRVQIDGERACSVKQSVETAQQVTVLPRPRPVGPESLPPPLPIVFEDQDLVIIDKPAGLLTSTVPRERRPTALAMLREYVARNDHAARVGLIHRLDRDASGLLVFSKNHEAFRSLKQQFFKHSVDRIYTAVICGMLKPPAGQIQSRLIERPDGSVRSTPRKGHGERAITHYQTLKTADGLSLVRVTLQTGRKHQIRVHLSERGAPILGDPVYAPDDVPSAPRLLLQATELTLDHPSTLKRMRFSLDLIPEARRLFR